MKVIIAVLDTEAEISLILKGNIEDLLWKGLRAPQIPVVNGALITASGNGTKVIKGQAFIEYEIDGSTMCKCS